MNDRERTRIIEKLERMMDELCAPDLTIARAKALRPRIYDLLGRFGEVPKEDDRFDTLADLTVERRSA